MADIDSALAAIAEDSKALEEVCDKIYDANFAPYFKEMRELYSKYKETQNEDALFKISDGELEEVLSSLPLQLYSVSESFSKFKLSSEIVKLRIKDLEAESRLKKEYIPELTDNKVLQSVYSIIVARVEKEISFTREFIMVAKKIWDARRATEQVSPIAAKNYELPEYGDISTDEKVSF